MQGKAYTLFMSRAIRYDTVCRATAPTILLVATINGSSSKVSDSQLTQHGNNVYLTSPSNLRAQKCLLLAADSICPFVPENRKPLEETVGLALCFIQQQRAIFALDEYSYETIQLLCMLACENILDDILKDEEKSKIIADLYEKTVYQFKKISDCAAWKDKVIAVYETRTSCHARRRCSVTRKC